MSECVIRFYREEWRCMWCGRQYDGYYMFGTECRSDRPDWFELTPCVDCRDGVGSELEALIGSLPVIKNVSSCEACNNLKTKMNAWGWSRCEENAEWIVDQIVRNARQSDNALVRIAARVSPSVPIKHAVRLMLTEAIRRWRDKREAMQQKKPPVKAATIQHQ